MFFNLQASQEQNDIPNTFRAPKGFIFEIVDAHWTPIATSTNFSFLGVGHPEDPINLGTADGRIIAIVSTASALTHVDFCFGEPIRTKYFFLGADGAAAFSGIWIVTYKLVRASLSELIWEYVGKRR